VYCEVERLANGRAEGDWIDFYIVAVSKEDPPDKAIIKMNDIEGTERFAAELSSVKELSYRMKFLKEDGLRPIRCEECDYCRSTKKIDKVIHYSKL
jgi:hypothetical protein